MSAAETCTRCGDVISDRRPSEGYTTRIGLTKTRIVWRLTFSRFRWHWLPKNPMDRVSAFYTELDLCDWCTGDVFLFAQGLPPRPSRGRDSSQTSTNVDAQPAASLVESSAQQAAGGAE